MKKLDKLIFKSFIGPFFLTFCVVVFIFLLQFLLRHFDDIIGKGLGADVYLKLLAYFSINMTPVSFPLAVLLSSLMTYGNLGEHSELTALKSAGISLTRTLVPMFVFAILLTIMAYLSNNYVVPKANLKAYSLLYDIKQKSPALNIKEGVFYDNIPGYQIKVNKKFGDGKSLKDIIIYNHTKRTGNSEITLADSGQMYTIYNDNYLVMELFDGHHYSEQEMTSNKKVGKNKARPASYSRNKFKHSKFIFSMASFDLKRTREELFAGNRLMKGVSKLSLDIDSMVKDIKYAKYESFINLKAKYNYHLDDLELPDELDPNNYGRDRRDSNKFREIKVRDNSKEVTAFNKSAQVPLTKVDTSKVFKDSLIVSDTNKRIITDIRQDTVMDDFLPAEINKNSVAYYGADSILYGKFKKSRVLSKAVSDARFVKNHIMVTSSKVGVRRAELLKFKIQKYKIFAQAFSCMIMFLIGAPLGSIIKRGGFGFPVIVSIGFFIVYYVFMSTGEKWAKEEMVSPFMGVWLANFILVPFGFFFLRQARLDARLFDTDFYSVIVEKIKERIPLKIKKHKAFALFNR